MTGSQKILLSAGLALTILGMTYGLWYALVDEHPTLERMGVSLASSFAEVANGEMEQARKSLNTYGETRLEYIREVHVHGHLVFGTAALPLGSVLEMFISGLLPKAVALLGAVAIIGGLSVVAAGFLLSARK